MDKVSNLAFLLYNESTNVAVKQAAVKLLTGVLTVKEIKNNNETKAPFNNASKKLRKGYIKKEELNQFIEQHMYSSMKYYHKQRKLNHGLFPDAKAYKMNSKSEEKRT